MQSDELERIYWKGTEGMVNAGNEERAKRENDFADRSIVSVEVSCLDFGSLGSIDEL